MQETIKIVVADYVILFDMGTPGTTHMLKEAIKKGVPHKNFLINE